MKKKSKVESNGRGQIKGNGSVTTGGGEGDNFEGRGRSALGYLSGAVGSGRREGVLQGKLVRQKRGRERAKKVQAERKGIHTLG